ncbi:MAG: HAMP domain-containing histidine kinase [Hahellaceae bacterium]|nr:HAMP domain-containing histidine kinase [Hahellaceae bacterium]
MTRLWSPKAVWQIVVVAMAAVLTPQTLLLYHTTIVLQSLAIQSQVVTENAIRITQATRNLSGYLTDLERFARQYQVLGDPAQKELFDTAAERLQAPLEEVIFFVRDPRQMEAAEQISRHLTQLRLQINANNPQAPELLEQLTSFTELYAKLDFLTNGAREQLRQDMLQQTAATSEAREKVIQTMLILVPITILMIVAFTVIIVQPMRKLKESIRRLGNEDPSESTPIALTGPSEFIRIGMQLEWLRRRLMEVNEQKHEFLRHVSHELKTPLSSIREGTELLKEEVVGNLTRAQKEVLELVDENSRALQHMIENLLLINRNDNPSVQLQEKFALQRLVEELLRYHSLSLANHGMIVCIGGPPVKLVTDRRKLHTVLDNLLSNAVAYGAEKGHIWLEWRMSDEGLIIKVANTGLPISETDKAMIFEPFYQGRRKRKGAVKGSGVGLAVARQHIISLGGTLDIINDPVANTCFRIQLPAIMTQLAGSA